MINKVKEKLNEDVTILDPQLAQQYSGIQKQIIDKQTLINNMNKEILTLQQNLAAIEQKAAQTQKPAAPTPPASSTATPSPAPTTASSAPAPKESVYSVITLDNYLKEALSDPSNIDAMDILNVDKDDNHDMKHDEESREHEELLSEPKDNYDEENKEIETDEYSPDVFYVKIEDDGDEFIAKIYKNESKGDWLGVIKIGENESFEKLAYEPTYDENDILEFLKDNYDEAEIISKSEFNEYLKNEETESEENYDDILDVDIDEKE